MDPAGYNMILLILELIIQSYNYLAIPLDFEVTHPQPGKKK